MFVVVMLLVTHGHYSADVFTGLVFAYFCFEIVSKHLKIVDQLVSSPYLLVKHLV